MGWIDLALLAIGVYVGAKIIMKIGGWLVDWARRAIRSVIGGIKEGVLSLVREAGNVTAYALAAPYGNLEVVDEIVVDEDDLSEEVLQALRNHRAISEKIYV